MGNEDFINRFQDQKPKAKGVQKEADYITESIYLFEKLLPSKSSKMTSKKSNKNVQIGQLTQESLLINPDNADAAQQHQAKFMKMQQDEMNAQSETSSKKSKR